MPVLFLVPSSPLFEKERYPLFLTDIPYLEVHALSTGLALLPDSPPVTTQSIPLKSICFNDPSKGSQDKNRIRALTFRRISTLSLYVSDSRLVPTHTLCWYFVFL